MVRELGQASYITFIKGLNTEAGPLTFPENYTIEDKNCVLTLKGSHKRRYGIQQEIEGRPLNIGQTEIDYTDFKNRAINTYTWKAPGNVGSKTFLVVQVTDKLFFYDISQNAPLPLTGFKTTISLEGLIVDNEAFKKTGCAFSSGKGYLFICGKGVEPCYVAYDDLTNSLSIRRLTIYIRDSIGVDDGLDNITQPTTLSDAHLYNLINQGWLYQGQMRTTGITSTVRLSVKGLIGILGNENIKVYVEDSLLYSGMVADFLDPNNTGSVFNNLPAEQRKYLRAGISYDITASEARSYLILEAEADHATEYYGKSAYMVVTPFLDSVSAIEYFGTSAEYADIGSLQQNTPYQTYFQSKNRYPSNAQQWFVGRMDGQQINVNEVASFDFGNKRAPRGRCVIDAFTEDRTLYVSSMGKKEDTARIIDVAFMGGRVFYLRKNSVLFSQVLEDIKNANQCYTEGDPTSEDSFDVVDTDGGVITITDMGEAIALFELPNGLAVFAKNGIWLVTGVSLEESFKATGYSVRKLSNLECVSRSSIVNVQGVPVFWATSGIYAIAQRDYVGYEIQSLSDTTIQSRYVEIPKHNLTNVCGIYNSGAQRAAWFYDDTKEYSDVVKERKTKALLYDIRLQAFYELDMDSEQEHPFICSMFNTPYLSFVSLEEEVYDNQENLIYDNEGNIIYTKEAIKNTDLTDVKYLAYEPKVIPAGIPRVFINDSWYFRDSTQDTQDVYFNYAWVQENTSNTVYTQFEEPTQNFLREDEDSIADTRRYYRYPSSDKTIGVTEYKAWKAFTPTEKIVYTQGTDEISAGVQLWSINFFNEANWDGHITTINSPEELEYVSEGVYSGVTEGYKEGLQEDKTVVVLTSCNFDDTTFKDWGTIDYTSTFTTGMNTTGDSFIKKDLVYLTTQLARTEAIGKQGTVINDSSCMMQMKWDFEDNEYSHKWTTPVQIYRARRLFAPGLETPGFDDISIRMPVITTKHKVRGEGRALQIKFISEPGKNFEVLGWNIIVGARR